MYERRAVLFLDILGFSELVQRGKENRLLAALQHVQGRALEVQERGKMNFTAFSDCVVVSAPLNDGKGALQIVGYAQFLALDLLARGLLTRGGIVAGDLYHEGAIVLGPALIEAYQLESKKALYPRILVTPEIKQLSTQVSQGLTSVQAGAGAKYFREDFDGSYHLDLFEYASNSPETYWGSVGEVNGDLQRTAFRDSSILFIDRIYASTPPQVAAEKYAWLARYFFEKCQEHLWPLPNNLPISEDKRRQYEQELHDMQQADQQE
jgi:hypothetical protein